MRKIWYFKTPGGPVCGPLDQGSLLRLAQSGKIKAEDIVWKEGTELRVQAQNVGGLEKFYRPKPPVVQGRQVETVYAQPEQNSQQSQAVISPLSLIPTHLDSVAIKQELVLLGKSMAMAATIIAISLAYHLLK